VSLEQEWHMADHDDDNDDDDDHDDDYVFQYSVVGMIYFYRILEYRRMKGIVS
jgi:hypothetical protein